MESKDIHGHPKQIKLPMDAHFPSISILPMLSLPEEVITEILLKLPVESLLKFRSVSKSWLSLISSPYFVNTHLMLSASNKDYTHHRILFKAYNNVAIVKDCSLNSLLYNSVVEAFDLDYPGKSYNYNAFTQMVGSLNGLICLCIHFFEHGLYDLFLWNPSIRKHKKLPNFRLNLSSHSFLYDHVYSQFGFAYDELQDDYKVVGVFHTYKNGLFCRVEVKIYSLKNDSWSPCISDFKGRELLNFSGKLVNGKLHWLQMGRDIVSFDLSNEKWIEIGKPCNLKGRGMVVLGVLGSDLSVSCSYPWSHRDIWVMKEYGIKESWTKMFTIKDDSTGYSSPIFVSNEGEIMLRSGLRFKKYNPKDDSITSRDVTNLASCEETGVYIKSLVCPF